jgi:hypothetical protein
METLYWGCIIPEEGRGSGAQAPAYRQEPDSPGEPVAAIRERSAMA